MDSASECNAASADASVVENASELPDQDTRDAYVPALRSMLNQVWRAVDARLGNAEGGRLSIKFFGQFLVEDGEVDASHLKDAADLMYWVNRRVGELAAKKGYMTRVDVDRIHRAQLSSDVPFGELAVRLNLLTQTQVLELIREQSANQLHIGEALVELGFLEEDLLQELVDRYDADQEGYAAQHTRIPEELSESPLAEFILDQVPKVALRTALFRVKIGSHREWTDRERCEFGAMISIRGDDAVDLGITADEVFMKTLFAATLEPGAEEPSRETLTDMLCAFLKVVAGSTGAGLEKRRIELKVALPKRDELPAAGFAFELVSLKGRGQLIIAKP